MKKYKVYIKAIQSNTVEIEADSKAEAIEQANMLAGEGRIELFPEDTEITIA